MKDVITVGIYYYVNEDGDKVYDEESMREEFENKLITLINKPEEQ